MKLETDREKMKAANMDILNDAIAMATGNDLRTAIDTQEEELVKLRNEIEKLKTEKEEMRWENEKFREEVEKVRISLI